jgi:16S rRNA C1402 N4-methylase RsmH
LINHGRIVVRRFHALNDKIVRVDISGDGSKPGLAEELKGERRFSFFGV